MIATATVIDLNLHRKRKQAQQRARAMWDMYAQQAGLHAQQWVQAAHDSRQA